jgi:phosphoribosylformimino-5-aminoimidazole carboxamide ribotide isomerase
LKSDADLKTFESGANQIPVEALQKKQSFWEWIAEYGADKIILGADANNEK